ncbi:MAG: DnaD domain protein [Bacilli bacterium]|nr:DnaD domain protein [Bacilli bacterium]
MSTKNYTIENAVYSVMIDETLTDLDRKVLTHCYLPIIGEKALSIYLTLFTMVELGSRESGVLNHNQLIKLTGIPKTKFTAERRKLEAVGLLSTYYKDTHFIYVLKKVLTPYEFFNNHDLVWILGQVIGRDDLDELAYNFLLRRLDPNQFENVTASFDEVFDGSLDYDADYSLIGVDTRNNGILINNKKFNIDHFIILVDAMNILDKVILQDENFLDLVKRYAFLYALSVEQLKDAVLLAVNVDKTINFADFENQVKRIYDNRNQNVSFVPKKEVVRSSDKLINLLNTISPNDLVKNKYQTELTSSEISMFDKLLKETNVSIGILNVCILYVLSEKNGEIPSFNYFKKIINTWIRAGITTTEEALNHINGKEPSKPKKGAPKTVKPLPSWYGKEQPKQDEEPSGDLDENILDFFNPKK